MSTLLPETLRALYPFESHFFQTEEGRLHYIDEGRGEVVLCLHGNPTWSFFYRNIVDSLKATNRVIAVDHLGCGLSDKPENARYTLAGHIDRLEALVRSLQITKLNLIVHDWGGAIGFGLAARMPQIISKIVILNTGAFRSTDIPKRIAVCRAPYIGHLLLRGFNAFVLGALSMAVTKPLSKQVSEGYRFPYNNWANRIAIDSFVHDIPLDESHPSYATLLSIDKALSQFANHPVKIVWGGKDWCFHDEFLAEWRRRFPRADVHYIAEAGHWLLEDAGQEVIESITPFLANSD